jgi:3-hydroxyisobutyrate dehydrogenase/glyoxylate/succinic semialdehyde reductase
MKVGFIGTGIMGSRMAANLQKNGYELVVHNRTKEKAQSLIENGASWADTPADVAEQADILFTMVGTPESVLQAASGSSGFLEHLKPGSLWVDCTTVNPSFSRQMAKEASTRKVRFVDAPVVGTKGPAAAGELLFLVGGDDSDVKACEPHFTVMGRNTMHVGEQGMGSAMKMVFGLLLGSSILAFSEAMALGQSMGISRESLFKSLLGAPVVAPFLSSKKEKIEEGQFDAYFPLKWMQKDLHLASVTAYEGGVALPVANAVKEVFAFAIREGLGDKDFSAVYQLIAR